MSNTHIIELITEQIETYQLVVKGINEEITALQNAANILQPDHPVLEKKAMPVKKIKAINTTPTGDKQGMKFSTFVLSILRNKSHKTFTSKEIKQIVADAVAKGKVNYSGKKDLVSTISASLHSQYMLGKIEKFKTDDGMSYKFNTGNAVVANSSDDELMIDKILEFTKDKSLSDTEISKKLFMDTDYMDIAKNLNGSLNSCTKKCLDNLLRDKKIDQDSEGKYFSI